MITTMMMIVQRMHPIQRNSYFIIRLMHSLHMERDMRMHSLIAYCCDERQKWRSTQKRLLVVMIYCRKERENRRTTTVRPMFVVHNTLYFRIFLITRYEWKKKMGHTDTHTHTGLCWSVADVTKCSLSILYSSDTIDS